MAARKILFGRNSACIQPLRALIEEQTHRTLTAWALDCAAPYADFFEARQPGDARPREALRLACAWSRGEIKRPAAKRAILAAHAAASEAACPAAEAAARAAAHAASTVHVETHALGLAFYGLTALALEAGPQAADRAVENELARLYGRLLYWRDNIDAHPRPWAAFLLRDAPNKERLLHEKTGGKPGMRTPRP